MLEEVRAVMLDHFGISLDEHDIFRVLVLSLVREVVAARDKDFLIDNDDLVMRDGVFRIDPRQIIQRQPAP